MALNVIYPLSYRYTCLVCSYRPVFDTVDMLAVHRKGKRHLDGEHLEPVKLFKAIWGPRGPEVSLPVLLRSTSAQHFYPLSFALLIETVPHILNGSAFQSQCCRRGTCMRSCYHLRCCEVQVNMPSLLHMLHKIRGIQIHKLCIFNTICSKIKYNTED